MQISKNMQVAAKCYHSIVPEWVDTQVKTISKELLTYIDSIYAGPAPWRYAGKAGDEFLKSKWFFCSDNTWELARSLFVLAIIGTVGILIAKTMSSLLAIAAAGSLLFVLSSVAKEYFEGNHLKKALDLILREREEGEDPYENLEAIEWDQVDPLTLIPNIPDLNWKSKKVLDEDKNVVGVAFNVIDESSQKCVWVYYFGEKNRPRVLQKTNNFKFIWKLGMTGREITALLKEKNDSEVV